jgi:hypothetical protein
VDASDQANAVNSLFADGSLQTVRDYLSLPNGSGWDTTQHSVTRYEYFAYAADSGYSPDQPYRVIDASNNKQYFYYNANNQQVVSWTFWDDPATVAEEAVRSLNINKLDAQGRTINSIRIVDPDVQLDETVAAILVNVDTYINNHLTESGFEAIIQSRTFYNSIGKVDRSIDENNILTKYLYDEIGNLAETFVYVSETAFTANFANYINTGSLTGILTLSQTIYDAEGRAIVSVGPYDPPKRFTTCSAVSNAPDAGPMSASPMTTWLIL